MITVSNDWVQMMNVRTNYLPSASILLADGKTLTVGANDIAGLRLGESGGGGALPVGAAICRTCELELVNVDKRYSGVVFAGAEVTVSLSYNTGSSVETILMGTYTVKQPGTAGTTVVLPCEDDMAKADKLFETTLTAPTTAGALWADICTSCGITGQTNIPQASFAITAIPTSEISFREVLGAIAMLSGGNARVSRSRTLEVINYDFDTLAEAREEETVPAGMHNLALWRSLNNDTEDVTITGVCTTKNTDDGGFNVITVGSDDNVLTLSNPLIEGREQEAMNAIGAAINGAVYRPFSGDHVSYPIAEFGDLAHVTDGLGNEFYTVLTDIAWEHTNVTVFSASAEVNDGTGAGTLSQRMTKVTADLAEIKRLKVDWADIETAVINTLEANSINADWINFKYLNCTGWPPAICPNEFDKSSLFPGQTVVDGWIYGGTVVKGSGRDTLAFIDGKKIELSFETKGPISGGSEVINDFEHAWQGAGGGTYSIPAYYEDGTPIYVYKYVFDFTGQSEDPEEYDPRGDYLWYFQVWVDAVAVRRVTLLDAGAGNVLLGPSGLEIGDFSVDRAGNVTAVDGHLGALYLNSCDDGETEVGAAINKAIKSITRNGTTFTYTCLDGTTGTFTQQDNDTWRGIQNNLTSTSTTDSLAAAQGKVLNEKITGIVKSAKFSGTTTSSGNLNGVSTHPIIGCMASGNTLPIPYKQSSGSNWGLHFYNATNGNPVASTAVSGTYYYLDV